MIMDNMVIFISDRGSLEIVKRILVIEISELISMGIFF